jgi:Tol biopolymer transport system component
LTSTPLAAGAFVTIAADGLVALQSASDLGQWDLTWFDRKGTRLNAAMPPGPGVGIDLSSDKRLGVTANRASGTIQGMWVLDFARALRTRLIDSPSSDAVISPDGRQVAYVSESRRVVVQGTFGGDARTVYQADAATLFLEDWSDDGQFLIVGVIADEGRSAFRVAVTGNGQSLEMLTKISQLDEMRLSPDGTWLAYNAGVSGRDEVYVSPVPPTGERIQISVDGGTSARWRDDGAELYYLSPDGTLMAVSTPTRDTRLDPARPVPLFKTGIQPTTNLDHYAVGEDGKTFLVRLPAAATEATMATIIANWLPR